MALTPKRIHGRCWDLVLHIFWSLWQSCTAGISIHPDIPRQTLMLSQHGCRQASFSLPLQGQFIPNLLSMWQVQLCYWFGQSVLMCSGMRNAYCLPPPLVCVSIKMLPGKCSEILDSSPPPPHPIPISAEIYEPVGRPKLKPRGPEWDSLWINHTRSLTHTRRRAAVFMRESVNKTRTQMWRKLFKCQNHLHGRWQEKL